MRAAAFSQLVMTLHTGCSTGRIFWLQKLMGSLFSPEFADCISSADLCNAFVVDSLKIGSVFV